MLTVSRGGPYWRHDRLVALCVRPVPPRRPPEHAARLGGRGDPGQGPPRVQPARGRPPRRRVPRRTRLSLRRRAGPAHGGGDRGVRDPARRTGAIERRDRRPGRTPDGHRAGVRPRGDRAPGPLRGHVPRRRGRPRRPRAGSCRVWPPTACLESAVAAFAARHNPDLSIPEAARLCWSTMQGLVALRSKFAHLDEVAGRAPTSLDESRRAVHRTAHPGHAGRAGPDTYSNRGSGSSPSRAR